MLPFYWKRVEVSGCSGEPSQVHLDRGWDLVSEGAWLLGVLAVLTLFLLWRSTRIDPNWRLFPATLGFLANAVLAFAIYFAATFELFSRARILWPGWVAMGSALALFFEGLTRFIAEILTLVRRRRAARRNRASRSEQ